MRIDMHGSVRKIKKEKSKLSHLFLKFNYVNRKKISYIIERRKRAENNYQRYNEIRL